MTTATDSMVIAKTILEQLGGRKFLVMTGAKNLMSIDGGLSLALPSRFATNGINRVTIEIDANDTYVVTFSKVWGSQHFGTIKKREKFTLTVIGLNEFESDWGLTTFVKMIDANGNVAMWKASGEVEMDLESTYIVTGTVKDHSVYRGVNQTVLSRCKCELVEPEASDEPVDPQMAELPY